MFVYRKLTWTNFIESARETVLACASILLIVGVSELFAWVLAIDQIPTLAAQFLIGLSSNPYVLLLIANVILLAAGTILEPLPAILLLAPIIAPGLTQAGVDPVHLGIVVVLNLMIGLLTPPVGMSLYMVSNIGTHSARARDGRRRSVHHLADHRARDRHVRPGVFDLAARPGHEMTQTKRSSP